MSYQPRREHNIVVLGAGGVGKSCLTARFVQDVWIESYDPTIEDSYRKQVAVDGKQVILEILDTAGTEQFTAMRELYMKQGQGFLLVYSITSKSSFQELDELRESIMRIKDDEDVPIVLVGNKNDMAREDREVEKMDGLRAAEKWGQRPFFEVSAKQDAIRLIEEPFHNLCRQIMARDSTNGRANGVVYPGNNSNYNPQLLANRNVPYQRPENRRKKRFRDRCTIL